MKAAAHNWEPKNSAFWETRRLKAEGGALRGNPIFWAKNTAKFRIFFKGISDPIHLKFGAMFYDFE